ncbi:MAG: biotin--[acetyl-CoA-carboxylase] ligase [Actinomycetes bacterium]
MRGDHARLRLSESRFADLKWVDETGSTNRDLLDLAALGGVGDVVLIADFQTAGRGRLDRSWHAPRNASLLASMLFRRSMPVRDGHLVSTAVGVSAVEACAEVAGVAVGLKWPNDLVIEQAGSNDYRKLGGILAESIVEGDAISAVVVGIGINVNWPVELPTELADIAVALNQLANHDIDREQLVIAMLLRLDHWASAIFSSGAMGRERLMQRARELSATLNRRVRVQIGSDEIEGHAVALTDAGELLVEVASADSLEGVVRHTIIAGDVTHVRPAQ